MERCVLFCSLAVAFLCSLSGVDGGANDPGAVQSKIISAVSDGNGGFKIVNGVPRKGAILKANFTNMINTTGSAFIVFCFLLLSCMMHVSAGLQSPLYNYSSKLVNF